VVPQSFLLWLAERQEGPNRLAPAGLGCPLKHMIQIAQYLQGEDVLRATSSNFLFRRERVRPLKNY